MTSACEIRRTRDSALSCAQVSSAEGMQGAIELKTIPREDVYKAVYSAKITAYKP